MAQQGPSITGPALSALAKDIGNKRAGSNARQIDLSSHSTSEALSPAQDPGLAHSGTQSRGLSLGVPVNVSPSAQPRDGASAAAAPARPGLRAPAQAARCQSTDAIRWENSDFDDSSSGMMI